MDRRYLKQLQVKILLLGVLLNAVLLLRIAVLSVEILRRSCATGIVKVRVRYHLKFTIVSKLGH